MKKYKKKLTIVLGKLSIVVSVLLGVLFGMPSSIYASVYQTGTSDHYSIQASQLATGREQIVLSWHNLYEGEYYNYVDLVQLKLKGANGTTYQLYLCLHGTDELTISFTNTDLTNMTVTTVQTWQFNDQNLSQLQTIANRINALASQTDDIEYYLTSIIATMGYIQQMNETELEWFKTYLSKIDLPMYNAFLYTKTIFMTHIEWQNNGSYFLNAPRIELYGSSRPYDQYNAISIAPGQTIIYVVASEQMPLYLYSSTYVSPDYSSDDVNYKWSWKKVSSRYYMTAYSYQNKSTDYIYYQHAITTAPMANYHVYPLYLGPYDECPYLSYFNWSTTSGTALNNENQILNDTTSDLNNIETTFTTDFDTNINAIDLTSPTIINGNDFLNSANWVRTRFNEITVGTPFGSLIVFSMIIGLALLLIGRTL